MCRCRFNFSPQDIYNIDETGFTTVQAPSTVVSQVGKKQVGAITSGERGQLVTVVCAINAGGSAIPPFYVFPRVKVNPAFLNGAFPGSEAAAAKSGWMNSDIFSEQYLPFFIRQTRCSKDRPILFIMDNHESHVSLQAINTAKENGIVILTLPPHTSHCLQPLDRAVYGPMKRCYNKACDDWLRSHPGRQISIYEIAELTARAHTVAVTPANIRSGFHATGISPLNSDIFPDDAYLPSDVTDRPLYQPVGLPEQLLEVPAQIPTPTQAPPNIPIRSPDQLPVLVEQPTPTRDHVPENIKVTPQSLMPVPKAPARKTKTSRKRRKTAILTDTPEKNLIAAESRQRELKKKPAKRCKKKQQIIESETSESELSTILTDSEEYSEEENARSTVVNEKTLQVGEHVLVRYETQRKTELFYIGVVEKIEDRYITVNFMRRKPGSTAQFIYPTVKDRDNKVTADAVVLLLGMPTSVGGSSRCVQAVIFDIDLSIYHVQ